MQYHRLLPAIFILFMGHFAHATEVLRIGVLYWSMNIPGQVAMRQGLEAEAERLNARAKAAGLPMLELVPQVAGDGPGGERTPDQPDAGHGGPCGEVFPHGR